jgi:hypothetical protein
MTQHITQIKFERATPLHISAEVGPEYFVPFLYLSWPIQLNIGLQQHPWASLMRYRNSDVGHLWHHLKRATGPSPNTTPISLGGSVPLDLSLTNPYAVSLDRSVNQDGRKRASLTLAYSASGSASP